MVRFGHFEGDGLAVLKCPKISAALLRAAEVMSYPTMEATGFSPAKSRNVNDGFSRGEPGLKPVSCCPFTARLKAVPFHRIRALLAAINSPCGTSLWLNQNCLSSSSSLALRSDPYCRGRGHPHVLGWMVHVYPYETDPKKIWSTDDDDHGHDNMDHSAMPGMKMN